ncbi:MAG: thioesterase family protein [Chloroflexota bacterium]|nr:thioesterase family protein [Chloroflexota bacterium]
MTVRGTRRPDLGFQEISRQLLTKSDYRFIHTLRVRWRECDVQGIAYYGSYIDFIDVAQAEYFRNLEILTHNTESRKLFDLAAVKVTLEYKSPAKIDDLIDVHIRVHKMGFTSIAKRWEIYRSGTNKLLATGETISVNYESVSGESRPLPDEIRRDIEAYEGMLKTP